MALEKINYEVAPEELVIQETEQQLKSAKQEILGALSPEQQAQATPDAIIEDWESQNQLASVEGLSDPEKLKKVQKSFKDMNKVLGTVYPDNTTISADGYKLSLKSTRGDSGYSTDATLMKGGKEVFVFELNSNMFHKEEGDDYEVNGAMTAGGNTLFYHGDKDFNHGLYSNNYDVLAKAEPYQTIIKKMVTDYNAKRISAKK